MSDKIPNVRAKALKVLRSNKKLFDKNVEKYVDKLKNDVDTEVRELATLVKAWNFKILKIKRLKFNWSISITTIFLCYQIKNT